MEYQIQETYTPVDQLSDDIRTAALHVRLDQRYSGTLPRSVAAPESVPAPEFTPAAAKPKSKQWRVKAEAAVQHLRSVSPDRTSVYGKVALENLPTGAALEAGITDDEVGFLQLKSPRFWGDAQVRVLQTGIKTELGISATLAEF